MNYLLKKALPHLIAIGVFLAAAALYFAPQLQGKVLTQGDLANVKASASEMEKYQKADGRLPLWTNSMFGGMPTYQTYTIREGNQSGLYDRIFHLGINRPIGRFFSAMLCFYILLMVLKVDPWVGIIGGIVFALGTNNLSMYVTGHTSKFSVICYCPLLVAGIVQAYQKKYLSGGLIFGLATALHLFSNHIQMTYYLALTLLAFGVAQFVQSLRKGELMSFVFATASLLVFGLIGLGTGASNVLPTLEYKDATMRGGAILAPEKTTDGQSQQLNSDGLSFDYAMQWSNTSIDLLAAIIPGAAGGSGGEPAPSNSKVVADLQAKGAQLGPGVLLPLYWGGLPFTSGPSYLGIISLLLFAMGLFSVNGPLKWWGLFGTLISLFLSMGKNDGGLSQLLFDTLPLYSSFRAPSSFTNITSVIVPIFGFLALGLAIKDDDREKVLKGLKIGGGILGGITLLMALLGTSLFDFSNPGDPSLQARGLDIAALIADRKSLFSSDAWRSFFLLAACAGLIWAWATNRTNKIVLLAGIGVLSLFDVWGVGRRYLNSENFQAPSAIQANAEPRPVDEEILAKEKDLYYRVHESSPDAFQSPVASNAHKAIGGYSPAKLQRYQDLIDRHLGPGNIKVYNMLNAKYFIVTPAEGQPPISQLNPGALGNAWMIDSFIVVKTPNEEINALGAEQPFDPAKHAVVHEEFAGYIKGLEPDNVDNTIYLTKYHPEKLSYQSSSKAESFAVFSDIWYGPDKGWTAYIDNKPVEYIRVNYALRGMRIPAGEHNIEFRFEPKSFAKGRSISMASSWALLIGTLGILGASIFNLVKNPPEEPAPTPKPEPAPRTPSAPATTTPRQNTDKRKQDKRKK
jgi:hypothetical protein